MGREVVVAVTNGIKSSYPNALIVDTENPLFLNRTAAQASARTFFIDSSFPGNFGLQPLPKNACGSRPARTGTASPCRTLNKE